MRAGSPITERGIFMKLARKFVCGVLVIAMLVGFAMPVQAWELPTEVSFDFATEYRLAINMDGFGEDSAGSRILANGVELGIRGTYVMHNPLAVSSFTEVSIDFGQFLDAMDLPAQLAQMMTMLGIDLAEPFRMWVEVDFSNVNDPMYVVVMELPMLVRTALTLTAPELARQFWVLDLSDILAEYAEELELALLSVTEEQMAEIFAYVEEGMREALAELQAFAEENADEIGNILGQAYDVFREVFTLHGLDYGHERLDNGHSAFFDFAFTVAYARYSVCVDFSFAGEVTNIGTAVAVPLPQLTARNSVDLMRLAGF